MKIIKPINHNTFIIEHKTKNITEYSLLTNNQIIPLISLNNEDSDIINYKYNNYYLIIYTCNHRGFGNHPNIEIAVDLINTQMLDIVNNYELSYALEDSFLYSHIFNKNVYLQAINKVDLHIVSSDEMNEFYDYIKCSNENITNDMVSSYILSKMPYLTKYANIPVTMSMIEFNKLYTKFCDEKLVDLTSIPQRLDYLQNNKKLTKKNNEN